jgi:uncharacterized RDD family membrane protein YckC
MGSGIEFETPENVRLSYQLAGPGTRFVAWFMDTILMSLMAVVVFIGALIAGASADIIGQDRYGKSSHAVLYSLGLFWIAYSLGNLLYFGGCELLLRGQTIGKRSMRIRVVKADGFSLDPLAIFLRTIFRVVDHLPPLYIVPILTTKGQRLGDLVAGTVVVTDEKTELGTLHDEFAAQRIADSQFQFDATILKRAREQDVAAVEKLLERWPKLADIDREQLLQRMVPPLAARLKVECPPAAEMHTFLHDLLAAEYRRQHRKLG